VRVLVAPSAGPITPEEVEDALRRLNMNTAQFARAIGVDEATMFRWRNGSHQPASPRQFRWAVQAMEQALSEPGREPSLV
jgi:DNA-binding transcriptional regulator YiaG